MVQTKQRQLILEAVRATNSHPTADELFQMIRRKLPDHPRWQRFTAISTFSPRSVRSASWPCQACRTV